MAKKARRTPNIMVIQLMAIGWKNIYIVGMVGIIATSIENIAQKEL